MALIDCKAETKTKNKLDRFLLKVKKDQDRRIKELTEKIINPCLTKKQIEDLILKEYSIQFWEKYFLFGDGMKNPTGIIKTSRRQ